MRGIYRLALVVALIGLALPATADTIFDNGTPDEGYIWFSEEGYFNAAEDFSLDRGASTITDIHWWGAYYPHNEPPQLDDFTVIIYEDDAGLPGAVFATIDVGDAGRTGTAMVGLDGLDIYEYSAVIDPVIVLPGLTYWVSIVNAAGTGWGWSSSDHTAGSHATDSNGWYTDNAELAFSLTDDYPVPEPATMTLLGIGLAGLVMRRRMKRS